MFERFWGNAGVAEALEQMLAQERLAQTLLFSGPEGVGKATLARRLGARLLGHAELIERDDLSLPDNLETVAARERWPADKRNEDPLLFATHPDFVTFAPEGPLRQISIQQTRLLKESAQYLPNQGSRRVFLIDHVDRANDQAANSLLKTLEEPPDHLVLIMTAENAYDLLLLVHGAGEIRNEDIRRDLEALAARVQYSWIRQAVARVDEIATLIRRNIQKTIALDALIAAMLGQEGSPSRITFS